MKTYLYAVIILALIVIPALVGVGGWLWWLDHTGGIR